MSMKCYNNTTMSSPPRQLANEQSAEKSNALSRGQAIVLCDTIVLMFYVVTAETIATVAHVCAIILGIVLWVVATPK